MAKPLLIALALLLTTLNARGQKSPESDRGLQMYEFCKFKATTSFGNMETERLCNEGFSLPGPFMLKCLNWVKAGQFPNELEFKSCRLFCKNTQNWGPWADFTMKDEDKAVFFHLKKLHDENRCQTPDFMKPVPRTVPQDGPDAQLLRCVQWVQDQNFPDASAKKSCRSFCTTNQNWGPWYDFEMPYKSKRILQQMAYLHRKGICETTP